MPSSLHWQHAQQCLLENSIVERALLYGWTSSPVELSASGSQRVNVLVGSTPTWFRPPRYRLKS